MFLFGEVLKVLSPLTPPLFGYKVSLLAFLNYFLFSYSSVFVHLYLKPISIWKV